jgi:hypothetical protein
MGTVALAKRTLKAHPTSPDILPGELMIDIIVL